MKFVFALSYISWFACVYLGKFNLDHYSVLIPILMSFIIHRFVAKMNFKFFAIATTLTLIGIIFDCLSIRLGWIQIPTTSSSTLIPIWLISLWLLFTVSLPIYLSFLKDKILLSVILGCIIGPLSYRGGEALNVLFFRDSVALIYYSVFWGFFFPISILFTKWSNLKYIN
jgi:hypothetical protein